MAFYKFSIFKSLGKRKLSLSASSPTQKMVPSKLSAHLFHMILFLLLALLPFSSEASLARLSAFSKFNTNYGASGPLPPAYGYCVPCDPEPRQPGTPPYGGPGCCPT